MHNEKGFEDLVLSSSTEEALRRFAKLVDWPPHLQAKYPDPEAQAQSALNEYFGWTKANWGIADFLAQCAETEIPQWLRESCISLAAACAPLTAVVSEDSPGAPHVAESAPAPSADAAH
jgi:putative ATP-dependent endonuclease of OLD family